MSGASDLANGLKHCSNLETLNLEHNQIADVGAKSLVEGLKFCSKLESLHVQHNKIGDTGAIGLAEGLTLCTRPQNTAFTIQSHRCQRCEGPH